MERNETPAERCWQLLSERLTSRSGMISDREIEIKAQEFGINPPDVEKDYVYGWLLNSLYTQSPLSAHLILKGATDSGKPISRIRASLKTWIFPFSTISTRAFSQTN